MTVVHCKKDRYDVYIGRPGKWGNPFGEKGTKATRIVPLRSIAVREYASHIHDLLQGDKLSVAEIAALRGKTLGCWCAPLACHGDVLEHLSFAGNMRKETVMWVCNAIASPVAYAGIGARDTPPQILCEMYRLGERLWQSYAHVLRSGGAIGADRSFYDGCNNVGGRSEIYEKVISAADYDQQLYRTAYELAESMHPAWSNCSPLARHLHTRNMFIISDWDLTDPVQFVICWTPLGKIVGGTGMGIRYAVSRGIPVINMYDFPTCQAVIDELVSRQLLDPFSHEVPHDTNAR